MGISPDNWHKFHKTEGKRKTYHTKRKYELGRPAANTKTGPPAYTQPEFQEAIRSTMP
jgi:small subunit ribosomal protein S8e